MTKTAVVGEGRQLLMGGEVSGPIIRANFRIPLVTFFFLRDLFCFQPGSLSGNCVYFIVYIKVLMYHECWDIRNRGTGTWNTAV